ncbi:hypothetical protein ATO6_02095 [Oceanicola sp. 22II-s10i]|uniref:hypothetical protein n=1 Tax=Oceanicola sp. 22II-s10i TaxID=1317116 RepID=UPI000B520761|nr:hypothetical protein [Oceanicola sp. 22II-s10i]OWU85730.1 hypothetical protein ATO6_02095 [Oceanicola sp. 22II-s10i]
MDDLPPSGGSDLIAVLFAGAVVVLGAVTLMLGWVGGYDMATRISPGYAAMVPSTAVSFIFLAVALIFGWTCDRGWRALSAYVLVFSVVGIVLVNLGLWFFASVPGLDQLVMAERMGSEQMSLASAVGLLIACYCVIALIAPDNPDPELPLYVSTGGVSTAAGVIGAHVFDPDTLYAMPFFAGMSIVSALCFTLLFLAVLCYPVDRLGTEIFRNQP